MAQFLSGRKPQLNIGVTNSTDNKTSLQVTGKVGIGTTNADGRSLYVLGDTEVTGVSTANRFSTGPEGVGFNITNNTITGPTEIIFDPAGVGDNTGSVRIKGDLYVDGEEFIVSSSIIELKDFQIGIATDIATNALLDGAGIGIGSTNIRKTLTYDFSSDSLKSSEHFDLDLNKTYKINEVEVLRHDQLTIPNAYVSGISTVQTHFNVDGSATVVGLSTFTGLVDINNGASIGNVDIAVSDPNTIDTASGDLILDSASGTTNILDFLYVEDSAQINGIDYTADSIYKANGEFRIIGGGSQSTRNNILFTNSSGLVIDGGSGDTTGGVEIRGGSGNVIFTQGRVGIETANPESTLDVNGDIRVVGFSTLQGYVDINDSVDISDQLNVGSGLTVAGYVDLNDALDVQKSLVVGGGTTLTGYVDINNSVDISNQLNVGSGLTVGGYVDINSHTNIDGELYVSGLSTIGGHVYIQDSLDIDDHLNVSGVSTFAGYVDVNNSLSVDGSIDVSGIVTATRYESDQSGLGNFFAGYQAGALINSGSSNNENIVIGYQAGFDLSNSNYNIAIGSRTLYNTNNNATIGNVAIGWNALSYAEITDYTIAIGYQAGLNAIAGSQNIFLGSFSASGNVITNSDNIAIGSYSARYLTSGSGNTLIGNYSASINNISGYSNVSLGFQSLYQISSGYQNTSIGRESGWSITNGVRNTLVGYQAGYSIQSNAGNVFLGSEAGRFANNPDYSVAIGYAAGYDIESDFGINIGYLAGYQAQQQYASVYIGARAGYGAQGDYNIAMGQDAMYAHDNGGSYNIALGYQAMYQDGGSSSLNIALGYQALFGGATGKTGIANIAIGSNAARNITSGSANITIGNYAGDSITSGSANVVLVAGATDTVDVPLPGGSNQLVIGSQNSAWIYGNSSYYVGLGTTAPTQKLDVVGNIKLSGAIHGPTELVIDPAGVGDNTGSVRIKGDLYVDGTQFIVNSSTIEFKDFQVGIASDVATNVLLDGAGIGIGSTNIRKTLTYDYSSDSLKSSEHFDLAANKTYKINEVEVLRDTQLTIPNAYVSGLGTITTLSGTNLTFNEADIDNVYVTTGILTTIAGTNLTYTNADIDNAYVTTGIVTTLQGTDVSYTNAYVNTGVVTTLSGTDVFYTYGNFTNADIDNAYVTTGIVTTLQGTDVSYTNAYVNTGVVTTIAGTNLNYTNGVVDNLYGVTGIITTLQGTDLSYTNAYVNTGVTTTLAGTNLTYTNADIDNAYVTTGIVTTLQGTDLSYTNAYVNLGIVTTIAGTNLTYTNADIDNAYVTTGIVTTLQGTDATYQNLYGVVGVVTTLSGTNLTYTNISNVGGISTLGVTSATNFTTQQLDVSGVSTFRSNVQITTGDFLYFGDSNQFSILFGGSQTFITQHSSDPLTIAGNSVVNVNVNGAENAIVATANGSVDLYYDNSKKLETTPNGVAVTGGANLTGVVTATEFHTGASGSAIRIDSSTITGPSEITIDPSGIGDDTGSVRIKGDLYVDGEQFIVDSTRIELADFNVGIASTVASNATLDGAGIGIGSTGIRKTLTYSNSSDALKSSEHFDLAANKTYKINGTEVLRDTQLTIPNAYVSGLGTIVTLSGTNLTYTNADIDNAYVTTGIVTTLQGTDVSYTNAYVNTGVVTTLSGTDVFYTYGNFTNADIDNAYVTTGIVTTLQGTDVSYTNAYVNTGVTTVLSGTYLTYANAGITSGYVVSGIVTTLQGTDATYQNLYGVAGIVTTLAGTNLTYTNADIDTAYISSGIITALTNTHFTSGIATITTIYGDFDGELNAPGSVYYVSENGSDSHTGDNINQQFATLAHALSVATSGDTILLGAGVFTEAFPLTVPVGVTIKGVGGLRGTFIQPTSGTKQNNGFLLNGETTIEDLTIGNFFEPSVAFSFASGSKTTTRSPYVQRVTVLNRGSVTSATDPYGFDTPHSPPTYYKAGRGVYLDGSIQSTDTLEAAMLFNECTFICPNNITLEMTNGARTEWVNCFTYFADKGIYAHDGAVGLGSTGYTRIKTGSLTGSTPQANDELYYLETNSISGTYNQVGTAITITKVGHGLTVGDRVFADFSTGTATDGFYLVDSYVDDDNFVISSSSDTTSGNLTYKEALGFGTIRSYNASSGISSFINKGEGLFVLPVERTGKSITAFGDAQLSSVYKKFGTASLFLDGTGDYARVTSTADFGFGTGNLTLEAFIRPETVTSDQKILDLRNTVSSDAVLNVGIATTSVVTVSYGSTQIITGTTALTTGSWYHIAVSRDGGSTKLFVDGVQEGSTYIDANNYGTSQPLVIGAAFDGTKTFYGYIDEVRVSITGRYTSNFTPPTVQLSSDGQDKLLAHFDGLSSSTLFTDSSIPTQDIRWVRSGVGIATATSITLADYQKFGGDMRSIGSACVFGNTGITADGPGCKIRCSAFNFSFIGSGKDFSQDISLVNQEAEVIKLNNGRVFFTSIDQSGDFRVGDAFYVDQERGAVNFGGQDFTLNSLSDLNITDGTNTTILTPTSITVGNIQLTGNEILTTTGDIVINPSGINSTRIEGDLTVTGVLDLGYSLLGGLDGDKGDISVANNFTTWTIDPNVVTFDKVQNVDGHTIVGRSSSGVGTVEALPVTGSGNVVLADAPTLSQVNITGVTTIGSHLNVGGNLNVTGTSEFVGVVTFRGGTINLGDSDTDDVVIGGEFASNLVPTTNNTYSLGLYDKQWSEIYIDGIGDIDTLYTTVGVVTTIAGTNLNYTNGVINNLYGVTGIVTTLQGTDATYQNLYGVSGIVTTLSGTTLTYTTADIGNLVINAGIVTTISGTNLTYTNADIDNAYVTTGIVTTIAGTNLNYTTASLTNAYVVSGVVTSLQATDVGINSAFVVSGIVTTLRGTDVSYTNAYVNTGIVTTIAGTNLNYTNGVINNLYGVTGIVTTIAGTNLNYTNGVINNLYGVSGIVTTIAGTNLNYTNGVINNLYGVTGIVTTIAGTNLNYTNGVINNLYGVSGIVTTIQSTDTSTTNLYATSGIVTTIAGTNLNYSSGVIDTAYITSGIVTSISIAGITTANSNGVKVTGIVTATQFSTGDSGVGININNNSITGPSEIIIDPAAVGDNTGSVRIKGDLFIDGDQFSVSVGTVDIGDFKVGIATTVSSDLLLDGAGIGIGDPSIEKSITFDYANDSLKSSENINIASGKQYLIDGTSVLSSTTLGNNVVNSSLTKVGTLIGLNVSGVSTFSALVDVNGGLDVYGQTELDDLNVAGLSTFVGIVTTQNDVYVGAGLSVGTTLKVDGLSILDSANISGNLSVTSSTDLNGTLDVANQATFEHNITLNAANKLFSIQNGSEVVKFEVDSDSGNTTIYGSLDTQSSATFSGNVSIASTFGVNGNVFLDSDATIGGDLQVDQDLLVAKTATNRVGVNIATPQYPLDVVGDINSSTAVKVNGVSVIQSAVDEALALAIALG